MTKILTGLRANGEFHIGNYLGSMLSMVNLQKSLGDDDSLNMFIADLHSFTTPIDHSKLYDNVINNVRMYLAAGLDPANDKTIVYRQSHVSAHAELAWILNCFAHYGELGRMVEFKDKSQRMNNKGVGVGLFTYPVLMAADILLYDAEFVPLGDDQKQHMELTRTLAERMNTNFGDLFTVPAPWAKQLEFTNRDVSVRIRSLSNPDSKMSKSVTDPKGTINLLDDPAEAAKKIKSAETDSVGTINFDFETQPGVSNLIQINAFLSGRQVHEVAEEWTGKQSYGELKTQTAEVVEKFLTDFQARYHAIDDNMVHDFLEASEIRANEVAQAKLNQVKRAVGLIK